MWQTGAAEKMSNLLAGLVKADEIKFHGSLNNPAELDAFSDVDMQISLSGNAPVNIEKIFAVVSKEFAPVFGYETISHSRKDAIRLCLENGMRFDLVFRYPSDKEPQAEDNATLVKVNGVASQFWFIASIILVKLGRRDNLVAAHLVLEMCQLIVVIQMILRDDKKDTNIHRFGDGEHVPVLHHSPHIPNRPFMNCETADEILAVLFSAAVHMDKMMKALDLGYTEKSNTLNVLAKHLLIGCIK